MTESVYIKYLDYTMAGLEDIAGVRGHNRIRDMLVCLLIVKMLRYERVNAKILRPIFVRDVTGKHFDASKIVRAYEKITLDEALAMAITTKKEMKKQRLGAIQESDSTCFAKDSFQGGFRTKHR